MLSSVSHASALALGAPKRTQRSRSLSASTVCGVAPKRHDSVCSGEESTTGVKIALHRTGQALASVAAAATIALSSPQAASAEKIGEFNSSGLIFKDTVQVVSVEDPKVKGVTIWIADYNRSLAAKLAKDFFTEPSQASITCAVTSPVTVAGNLGGSDGEEVFAEGKNLFQTKTLRIRRMHDVKTNSLVYVAYSTRISSNPGSDSTSGASRYRTSVCSVVLPQAPAPIPVSGP